MMNGVGDDVNMEKGKTLMHTAMVNSRKAQRPGQAMPMQPNQPPSQAQMMTLKQQQQAQQQAQQTQQQQQQQQQVRSFY
jgi:hypothetical protein